jgi:putative iron-only hydrogenase system regulator
MSSIKVVGIQVDKRTHCAPKVQEVLTKYGDHIIARYGTHDPAEKEKGLITLNFVGSNDALNEMKVELNSLDGVTSKSICME